MTELNAVPNSEVGEVTAENPMLVKFTSLVALLENSLKAIPKSQKTETERMNLEVFLTSLKAIASADNRLKAIGQTFGLYEVEGNQEEIEKLQTAIKGAKAAMLSAGFAEDSDQTKGVVKGLSAELTKSQAKVIDNQAAIAEFLGVKLGKSIRVTEQTGQLAMYRPNLESLKNEDWLYKEGDNSGIVVHSMTISESELAKLNIKAASDTWVCFVYNGELQYTRSKTDDLRMVASVTNLPESWVSVKPLTSMTLESLSGFTGKIAHLFGKSYAGNGWQGMAILAEKFNKIDRVVKEA